MPEYGFQSMPSFSTLRTVTKEEDWHPLSPLMLQVSQYESTIQINILIVLGITPEESPPERAARDHTSGISPICAMYGK